MKVPVKKITSLFLIACSLLFLGYYRDFIFKSINALLKAWDFDMDYSLSPSLSFLENYEYDTLLNIKWVLTFLFSILYLIVTVVSIKLLFGKKKYMLITIGIYAAITFVSGIFITSGYMFAGISEKMYEFARYLMGMLQSPIILMILIPILKLSEKEKSNITN